jgi:hypothetical protein
MVVPPTAIDLIDDEQFLAPWFAGSSWDTWRSILRAAYALPLSARDLELFHQVAGDRDPPRRPVQQLCAVAGRRAGKGSAASPIAIASALGSYDLRPGEKPTVLYVACDRAQAERAMGYVAGYFSHVPMLRSMVIRQTASSIELNNGAIIEVATNDFRAVRNRTIVCAILDEAAYYNSSSDEGSQSDLELYSALLPALSTTRGLLVVLSTPFKKAGLLFDLWKKYFGRPDDTVLVVRGSSTTFNSTLDPQLIARHFEDDPQRAAGEWNAEWRQDLSDYLDRDSLELCIDRNVVSRPPERGVRYLCYADASGGKRDSFTACVAHRQGDTIVIDYIFERVSPHDPLTCVEEVSDLLKRYNLSEISGDEYSYSWVEGAFRRHGIAYHPLRRDRSSLYAAAWPIFAHNRVKLLDHPRMLGQLIGLQQRVLKTGRTLIDHVRRSSDDLANVCAGVMVLANTTNVEDGIYTYTMERAGMRSAPPTPERERMVRIRRPAHHENVNAISLLGGKLIPIDPDGTVLVPQSCVKDFVLQGWSLADEPEAATRPQRPLQTADYSHFRCRPPRESSGIRRSEGWPLWRNPYG